MSAIAKLVKVYHMFILNDMRTVNSIFSFLAAAVFAVACSGNIDDASLPELSVSDTEIDLATETQAVFTVTYNGVDVTSESVIYSVLSTIELQGNVYTPENEGEVQFYAVYNELESNRVTVNTINTAVQVESKYDRHVSVIEFTGAWCINCPEGYDKMMGVLSKPSMAKYKENIHICAFHSDLEGDDDLAIPETQDVFNLFDDLAYPSFTTDLRVSGILTSEGISDFQPSLIASFEEFTPHCGVAVSSVLAGGKADVTVKVASEKTSAYRVVVLVVEDKIKSMQKTPLYSEGQADYLHRHVVRKVVTDYSGTFTGEKLTSDGIIAAGNEASDTWSFDLDGQWVPENTEIYALVLDENGYVNNMNLCEIDGGDSGYALK